MVTSERNEQTRRKELTTFTYDTSRCMFCGLCEDACPVDALELTQDFELASYTREGADLGPADARGRARAHSIQMLTIRLCSTSSRLLVLGGAVLTITRRNAVHSAIFLIMSLIGVAGLYLLQQAEFLFAVQIVLYVGGIMLLFLFVIMLVNLDMAAQRAAVQRAVVAGAGVRGGGGGGDLLLPVAAARDRSSSPTRASRSAGRRPATSEQMADVLFSEYLLPFEIASHAAAGGGGGLGGDGEEEDLTSAPDYHRSLPGAERGAAADRHGRRADPPQHRDHSDVDRADFERGEHQPDRVLRTPGSR